MDSIANTLKLKELKASIETLRSNIENTAVVQQILTINRYATEIQKEISTAMGSARSVMGTFKRYAGKIIGTINQFRNGNLQDLIPFFDPSIFTGYQEFLNLKDEIAGGIADAKGLANIQAGSPFQWATLSNYYNKNTLAESIRRAQQINESRAEIGDERVRIQGLDNILGFTQSIADTTARAADAAAETAYQVLSDNVNMAILQQAEQEARERANRQAIANSLAQ
jgi:hypothetical protein